MIHESPGYITLFLRSNYKLLAGIIAVLLPLSFLFLFLPSTLSQQALLQQKSELQSLGELLHQSIEDDLQGYARLATSLATHPEIVETADSSTGYTTSITHSSALSPKQSLVELFNGYREIEPNLDSLFLLNAYGRPWLELAVREGVKPPAVASLVSETSPVFHLSTVAAGRVTGLWVAMKINQSPATGQANHVLLRFKPEALMSAVRFANASIGERTVYIRSSNTHQYTGPLHPALAGLADAVSLDSVEQHLQSTSQPLPTARASQILQGNQMSPLSETDQLTFMQTIKSISAELVILDNQGNTSGGAFLNASENIRSSLLYAILITFSIAAILVATVIRSTHNRLTSLLDSTARFSKREYGHYISDSKPDVIGGIARQLDSLSGDFSAEFSVGLALQETVHQQQSHDKITQLPNRESVLKHLSHLQSENQTDDLVLFMIELSDIDGIRQTHGEKALFHIYQTITQRIHEQIPDASMVGQWQEGSFVVLQQIDNDISFKQRLPAVMQTLATDVSYNDTVLQLDFNHGIAQSSDGTQPQSLVTAARSMITDQARLRSHDGARILESANIVEETMAAKRLSVVYQPVMSLAKDNSQTMAQAEVTVRLHAANGDIHPNMDVLNDIQDHTTGMVLDQEVIVTALGEMLSWHELDLLRPDFRLSLNLTRYTVKSQGIVKLLRKQVLERGVKPERLILEISPMAFLQNNSSVNAIRSMGVSIAVDDVATEELSISQLQSMRPDFMKMDVRILEQGVNSSDRLAKAQLRTRLAYFRSLGISIIVKNIESPAQLELAKEFGVKLAQGHQFARPGSGQQFIAAWGEQQSSDKAA